jgi:hypothetical protein
MPKSALVDRVAGPSRILLDVAEGNLDEDGLEAVAAWLIAGAPDAVPEHVIERGLRARPDARPT